MNNTRKKEDDHDGDNEEESIMDNNGDYTNGCESLVAFSLIFGCDANDMCDYAIIPFIVLFWQHIIPSAGNGRLSFVFEKNIKRWSAE